MEYFKLEEVATFVNGYAFSSEKYEDKGIPIIRISDIDEEIKLEDCICYPEKSLEKLKEYTVKKGSLLIALSGATTGKMGVFNSDRIAYLNQRICSIFSKDKNLLQEYLIFYLKNLKEIILKNSYGGAQPNISSKWLEKRVIGIPSLTEQKEIVVILDKLVTIINKKKNQINLLEELVKSRFIEMFGEPIRNDKGWEIKKLGEVTNKISSGATPTGGKENYEISGISLIRSMNVHNGYFEYKDLAYISNEQARQLKNVEVELEDILLNITGASIARNCLVPSNIIPARVNQHVMIIRIKNKILNSIFLNNLFLNNVYKQKLINLGEANGATRQALTKIQIEKLEIILPPLSFQNEFAEFVTKTNKLKFEAEKSLKEMENLYESLMQKFFKQN